MAVEPARKTATMRVALVCDMDACRSPTGVTRHALAQLERLRHDGHRRLGTMKRGFRYVDARGRAVSHAERERIERRERRYLPAENRRRPRAQIRPAVRQPDPSSPSSGGR